MGKTAAKPKSAKAKPKVVVRGPGKIVAEIKVGGVTLRMGADLRFWRQTKGSVEAWVPLSTAEAQKMVYGAEATAKCARSPKLDGWDETKLPPLEAIWCWKKVLTEACDGEAYAVLCRGIKRPSRWLAVVPDQKATMGGVDTEKLMASYELAFKRGFEPTGTLHLHPGAMLSASGTDTKEWREWPGVYVIAPRTISKVSVWVSAGKVVWDTGKRPTLPAKLELTAERKRWPIVGEDGRVEKLGELIQKPKPKASPVGFHVHRGSYVGHQGGREPVYYGDRRGGGKSTWVLRGGKLVEVSKKERRRAKKARAAAAAQSASTGRTDAGMEPAEQRRAIEAVDLLKRGSGRGAGRTEEAKKHEKMTKELLNKWAEPTELLCVGIWLAGVGHWRVMPRGLAIAAQRSMPNAYIVGAVEVIEYYERAARARDGEWD